MSYGDYMGTVEVAGLVDDEGDGVVDALWSIRALLSKILLVLDRAEYFGGYEQ